MTKISVIFPFFNGEYYIEEAMDSLINQTIFEDIEVIIVDDGSIDNARFLVNKYVLDYDNIHLFCQENKGVSSARNLAMKHVKGEYVHFMDADDFLPFDTYEKLYDLAKKGNYDIVSGAFLRFNDDKTWMEIISKYIYEDLHETMENIQLKDYPNLTWDMLIWNKLYKRELLEKNKIQFPLGLRFQDNLFSMEVISKASSIALIPDYVYFWRVRNIGESETQQYNIKRMHDLIKVFGLVNEFIKENIHDKNVLATKYLKWLVYDIPGYIRIIPSYPKENHEFLLESIYDIYESIPKEYTKDLNTHFTLLYEMLENKDWESLLLYGSNDYKNNPVLPDGLEEEYVKKIDFKKDALDECLDIYTRKVSKDGNHINFKIGYLMPYISNDENHEIHVKVVSPDSEYELDSKYIKGDEFSIDVDSLGFGESALMMTYKADGIEKEYYLKTSERESYCYDDFDVEIARGNASDLRLIKRHKGKSDYTIKEVDFEDGDFIELKGISSNTIENISIKDYLDFVEFKYPIKYERINDAEHQFVVKIPYNDLLKVPVKKWDFYLDGEFNKIHLEEDLEFINEKYRIFLKNYGNRIVLELYRYNPIETIEKLESEKIRLSNEKQGLIKEKEQLKQDINKISKEKEELTNKKQIIVKERDEHEEKNRILEEKVKEFKNRKDVRAVDFIKKILHK